jgi:hypothetical protein
VENRESKMARGMGHGIKNDETRDWRRELFCKEGLVCNQGLAYKGINLKNTYINTYA